MDYKTIVDEVNRRAYTSKPVLNWYRNPDVIQIPERAILEKSHRGSKTNGFWTSVSAAAEQPGFYFQLAETMSGSTTRRTWLRLRRASIRKPTFFAGTRGT